MNTETQGNYVIKYDGESVWVNGLLCNVARFGPVGFEFNNLVGLGGFSRREGTSEKDWAQFVRLVRSMFGVVVGDLHKPTRLMSGRAA